MPPFAARIGPFSVIREIGRGGMGVVHLARDTRLDREVAIKALPPEFSGNAERMARFEREARTLAQLSHTGIAGIYGVEEQEGQKFLVLEYVEGETLGARLDRGRLPVDEALGIGLQIATAVEAAHSAGVVHRDLKPDNIKLTPDGKIKVLDFGLARSDRGGSSSSSSESPTLTTPHSPTIPGAIMGTAAYMSPEQARGRPVDKRTDIWSFGVVTYELLTGVVPFGGQTVADSIGATLHRDPDWTLLPEATPPGVRLLLRRCLVKDRDKRLHDIADARIELEEAIANPGGTLVGVGGTRPGRNQRVWLTALAVLAVALSAALLSAWLLRATRATPKPIRMSVLLPEGVECSSVAVSPDGTAIAITGFESGDRYLWVRSLESLDMVRIPDSEGAELPVFSPDGASLAFVQNDEIRRVPSSGGLVTRVCRVGDSYGGLTWPTAETLEFSVHDAESLSIKTVPARGGEVREVARVARPPVGAYFFEPRTMGRADQLLATAVDRRSAAVSIDIIDSKTGARRTIVPDGSDPIVLASGDIVFYREGSLLAAPFDANRGELNGAPVPIEGGVRGGLESLGSFDVSASGTLVYAPGADIISSDRRLVWEPFGGEPTPVSEHRRAYIGFALSPDDRRVAVCIGKPEGAELAIIERDRDVPPRRVVAEGGTSQTEPAWSADGRWVFFTSKAADGVEQVMRVASDFSGTPERVASGDAPQSEARVSPDGSLLAFCERRGARGGALLVVELDESGRAKGEPREVAAHSQRIWSPSFSRDGAWLAYSSSESGSVQVQVRPAKRTGPAVQVSINRGWRGRFSPTEDALYIEWNGIVQRFPYTVTDGVFVPGAPVTVCERKPELTSEVIDDFEISSDGKRIVYFRSEGVEDGRGRPQRLVVVLNWGTEVTRVLRGR